MCNIKLLIQCCYFLTALFIRLPYHVFISLIFPLQYSISVFTFCLCIRHFSVFRFLSSSHQKYYGFYYCHYHYMHRFNGNKLWHEKKSKHSHKWIHAAKFLSICWLLHSISITSWCAALTKSYWIWAALNSIVYMLRGYAISSTMRISTLLVCGSI